MTDDLNKLTTWELGHLFPIIITDYNPDWEKLYRQEKQKILNSVGNTIIKRIEHIGSTAVPGLCAKPTIDILIEVHDKTSNDLIINMLQSTGYQYIPKPENPPPHMMFARGYSLKGAAGQTYHLHIRYAGDWDELVFRDYMINNPGVSQEYGRLKISLSTKYKNDREKYTEGKSDFIKRIIKKARNK